jgi:hypothetical protein
MAASAAHPVTERPLAISLRTGDRGRDRVLRPKGAIAEGRAHRHPAGDVQDGPLGDRPAVNSAINRETPAGLCQTKVAACPSALCRKPFRLRPLFLHGRLPRADGSLVPYVDHRSDRIDPNDLPS